jgi:hypothetical protein
MRRDFLVDEVPEQHQDAFDLAETFMLCEPMLAGEPVVLGEPYDYTSLCFPMHECPGSCLPDVPGYSLPEASFDDAALREASYEEAELQMAFLLDGICA